MSIYQTKGRIFNIQRFSIHDGPGIRTIVFFKGCYMRCAWCCNPESQEYDIQTLTENGKEKTVGRDVTVEEILPELLSDEPYYRRSGGGITLSGGEILAQPEFARDLLHACKDNGLHTAVESTANAPWENVAAILPYLDLYLMDIKHMNSAKHKEYTRAGNELILENAQKIARSGTELIIRTPVVPTFNDTAEEIRAISRFAASLPGVKEHHLLPYHRLGQDKYAGLNRKYALKDIEPPTRERMEYLLSVAEESGLKCQIGG
ncbi:MAG: glycyl-radical enzyme activating protein [Candidatus Borkfalkiaceae bacterium]|nr:glycyl-radical enzyme activating protein [Clostridia bacterium]MDY6223451.1 glycyl-radical enzyme activating protein [Christensenellaceae bacterium]